MLTKHRYLEKYPISPLSEKLIMGTMHPHDHHNFMLPFFYGKKLSIWKILNEASNYEMGQPITLEGIINFLENHKISVSDAIVECERKNPTALDQDLIPTILNHKIIEQIKNSKINEILFTSGFQKNSAFKLFYADILGLKITPEIRREREIVLDKKIFGRPVKLTILYSPSGAANIAWASSKIYRDNKHYYEKSERPVHDFKIDYYREKFGLNDKRGN